MKIGITKFDNFTNGDLKTLESARIEALYVLADNPFPTGYFTLAGIAPLIAEVDEYVQHCSMEVAKAYALGCRHFELHYYPNCMRAGWGWAWKHGEIFADWWVEVATELRIRFPDIQIGYPKLEIGGEIGLYRANSTMFMRQSDLAVEHSDFIVAMVSWKYRKNDDTDMQQACWYVRNLVLTYQKPVHVIFFNKNNNVSKANKGTQYLKFYREMMNTPMVESAFCHTLSSKDQSDSWAVWRSDSRESAIPQIVGAREF